MKRPVLALIAVLLIGGTAFAQGWTPGRALAAEGTLGLQNGVIVLTSGDTVYAVPALSRYVGFIEGLKEGARVSIEGCSGAYNLIYPSRITLNGKTYDLAANPPGALGCGMAPGRGRHAGYYGLGGNCCW